MIELKNIRLGFKDKLIFNNFNYIIRKGDKILLNGPSGTGKTTFFRLLLGFSRPEEGEIFFDQRKLEINTVREIRRRIGYLSQEAEIPPGKASEVIKMIFNYKWNREIRMNEEKLFFLLDYFSLGQAILPKDIESLSGGERQRLLLIILLLLERDIYLLDEPTSALDEELRHKVKDYFLNIPETILVISHDKIWEDESGMKILNWAETGGK